MDFHQIVRQLKGVAYEFSFSLKANTTVHIGGNSPLALFPSDRNQLVETITCLSESSIPYFLLGYGSNVLVSDQGYDGVVVCTKKVNNVTVCGQNIQADCGASVGKILQCAVKCGIGGLEFLAGIPAGLGGLLFMNAGACSKYISDVVVSVDTVLNGKRQQLLGSECEYGYKQSRFMHSSETILGGVLCGGKTDSASVAQQIKNVLAARKLLPKEWSLGCVFKNPVSETAGSLIERCGLKGLSCGGAAISSIHANFIINHGNATATQYRELIQTIQKTVYNRTGVLLQEEIRYLGEF